MKKIISYIILGLLLVVNLSGCSSVKEIRKLNSIVKDFQEKIDPEYQLSVCKNASIKLTQVVDEENSLKEIYKSYLTAPDCSEKEFFIDVYEMVYMAKKMARDLNSELKNVYNEDIPIVVELIVKNKVIYSVDSNGKVIKDKIDDEIDFDYDYYKGIKGKWYECDNYWVSEKFYEKNKEPYWFYDSCSPSEYEGEDEE